MAKPIIKEGGLARLDGKTVWVSRVERGRAVVRDQVLDGCLDRYSYGEPYQVDVRRIEVIPRLPAVRHRTRWRPRPLRTSSHGTGRGGVQDFSTGDKYMW
jgi:hypothetical protein